MTAKAVGLQCMHMVEETAAALTACFTPQNMDIACKRDESGSRVKRLNTYWATDLLHISAKEALQSELYDNQISSPWFRPQGTSVCVWSRGKESRIALVGQQHTVLKAQL